MVVVAEIEVSEDSVNQRRGSGDGEKGYSRI